MLVKKRTDRDKIVREIQKRVKAWYRTLKDQNPGPIEHYCPWWAKYTVEVLREHRLPAQLQAGSAFWRITPDELDDGIVPLKYGYEFNWDIQSAMEVASGNLPEMHVWVAITPPNKENWEVVDLTAPFFKLRVEREGKYQWRTPAPPDYLWVRQREFPRDQAIYSVDPKAIRLIYGILQSWERDGVVIMPGISP